MHKRKIKRNLAEQKRLNALLRPIVKELMDEAVKRATVMIEENTNML